MLLVFVNCLVVARPEIVWSGEGIGLVLKCLAPNQGNLGLNHHDNMSV